MNFPKDQDLFENVSAEGKVIVPEKVYGMNDHPRAREIMEFDRIYTDFVLQSCSYNIDLKDLFTDAGKDRQAHQKKAVDGKRDLLEIQHKHVENMYRSDFISGFLPAQCEIFVGQVTEKANYFNEHAILSDTNQESVCGGAFHRLRSILYSFVRPVVHPFCFLLSLACAYVLNSFCEGNLNFWACAIMVVAGIVLFFTDFEEDVLSKFLCSIFFKIAVAVLSVLAIVGGFRHTTMMAVPIMYYYVVITAAMLVDYLIHLLKCTRNQKVKKEFCSTYETCAQDMHRYIRYHALWWEHIHPGEALPPSIEQMNRDFDMFSQKYKRFK